VVVWLVVPHPPTAPPTCWVTGGWLRVVLIWVVVPRLLPRPLERRSSDARAAFLYLWIAARHPSPAPLTGPANEEGRTQSVADGRRFAQRRPSRAEVGTQTRSRRVSPGASEPQPPPQPRRGVPVPAAARRPSRRTGAAPHGAAPARSGGARSGRAHGGPVRAGGAGSRRPRRPAEEPRAASGRRLPDTRSRRRRFGDERRRGAARRGPARSSPPRLRAAHYLGRGAPSCRRDARSGTRRRSGSDPAGRAGKRAWLRADRPLPPGGANRRVSSPPSVTSRRGAVLGVALRSRCVSVERTRGSGATSPWRPFSWKSTRVNTQHIRLVFQMPAGAER